ncbi:MAG: hypothetical protein IPK76_04770 [Lewinellaceae bacterium]|nr:hypothetical protein [Lewinellaceae bacterium]
MFSLTYYAQWLYFRFPFDLVKYSGYLALLLGISSLESSALILRDFYGFLQRKIPFAAAYRGKERRRYPAQYPFREKDAAHFCR